MIKYRMFYNYKKKKLYYKLEYLDLSVAIYNVNELN